MYNRRASRQRVGIKTRRYSRKGGVLVRRPGYQRKRYQYGPVGGHQGRPGTTQIIQRPIMSADRAFVTLKKAFVGAAATGAAGAFATSPISPNDCKDPLVGFGSGSPEGFNSWCSSTGLYGSYIVHAFKLEWNFINENLTAASGPFNCVVCWNFRPATTAAAVNMPQAMSQPRAVYATLNSNNPWKGSRYFTVAEIYGQSPQTVAIADSFAAIYNATPSSQIAADLSIVDPSTGTAQAINGTFVITQYIEFFGRVQL